MGWAKATVVPSRYCPQQKRKALTVKLADSGKEITTWVKIRGPGWEVEEVWKVGPSRPIPNYKSFLSDNITHICRSKDELNKKEREQLKKIQGRPEKTDEQSAASEEVETLVPKVYPVTERDQHNPCVAQRECIFGIDDDGKPRKGCGYCPVCLA